MIMINIIEKKGPIGVWVKKADYVFTNLIRETSGNGTFNRIEWQFFNFINENGPVSENKVTEFLSFFSDKPVIMKVFNRFEIEDLVINNQGKIMITNNGKKVYEELLKIQEQIKEKATEGITPANYIITIKTLQKIMDNLKEYLPDEGKSGKINKDKNIPHST